jgi:hypothetical protein
MKIFVSAHVIYATKHIQVQVAYGITIRNFILIKMQYIVRL